MSFLLSHIALVSWCFLPAISVLTHVTAFGPGRRYSAKNGGNKIKQSNTLLHSKTAKKRGKRGKALTVGAAKTCKSVEGAIKWTDPLLYFVYGAKRNQENGLCID